MAIHYSPPRGGSAALVSMGQEFWPPLHTMLNRSIDVAQDAIDAAADKVAHIGMIRWEDGQSHVVSAAGGGKIVFYLGATTFANASSTYRVGLQDVNTATGLGPRPDGTFDVFRDYVGGTDVLTGSARNEFTMSGGTGSKTIPDGGIVCAVIDAQSRGGTDSVIVGVKNPESPPAANNQENWPNTYNAFTGAAWTKTGNVVYYSPNFYLISDDGKIGLPQNSPMITSISNSLAMTSTSTPDERGNLYTLPKKVQVDGIWAVLGVLDGTAGVSLKFYENSLTSTPGVLGTATVNPQFFGRANVSGLNYWYFDGGPIIVPAGDYGATILATQNVNVLFQGTNWIAEAARAFPGNPRRITRSDSTGAFSQDASAIISVTAIGLILGAR